MPVLIDVLLAMKRINLITVMAMCLSVVFFMQSTLFITLLQKYKTFRFSNRSFFNATQLLTFIMVVGLSFFLNIKPLIIKNFITCFLTPKG